MRWEDFRRSENVEDDRGGDGGFGGGGGLGLRIGWRARHRNDHRPRSRRLGVRDRSAGADRGCGNPAGRRPARATSSQPSRARRATPRRMIKLADFISAVLGNTEDIWGQIFADSGRTYQRPKLRLFSGAERTPCVYAQSAMGPFYCPTRSARLSRHLVLPRHADAVPRLQQRQGLRVLRGLRDRPRDRPSRAEPARHSAQGAGGAAAAAATSVAANQLQVRVELQADCLAGVWANRSNKRRQFIEPGDVEQALQTASAIGDDRLQKQSRGYVVPDCSPTALRNSASAGS